MRNVRDGEKRRAARKAYYAHNKAAHKSTRLKGAYGISIQEFDEMREKQGFCCAACGDCESLSTHGVLVVDHCHKTKKVRGLLCNACNRTVGHAKEDPTRLIACASYLRGTNA